MDATQNDKTVDELEKDLHDEYGEMKTVNGAPWAFNQIIRSFAATWYNLNAARSSLEFSRAELALLRERVEKAFRAGFQAGEYSKEDPESDGNPQKDLDAFLKEHP